MLLLLHQTACLLLQQGLHPELLMLMVALALVLALPRLLAPLSLPVPQRQPALLRPDPAWPLPLPPQAPPPAWLQTVSGSWSAATYQAWSGG